MTNFSYLYDFVRTQVKLLGELGGVNGRARQLMINALSNSLAIFARFGDSLLSGGQDLRSSD